MPSTSAKQHRFMAAIANNPAFAKKVGVPQSVGKDYAAADKGKKFAAGGTLAKVNKQDTKHGAMDMPFKKLNKFAGMKKGGKIKRYEEGGDVDEGVKSYAEPQKSVKTEEGPQKMEEMKMPSRPVAKAKPAAPAPVPAAKPAEAKATPSGTTNAGAASSMAPRGQLGRLAAKSAGLSDEAKEEAGKRAGLAIASFAPIGRAVQGLHRLGAGIKAERAERAASSMSGRVAERQAEMAKARASRVEKANKEARREAEYDARRASDMEAGYKKGGMTKRFAKGGLMDKGVDKKMPTGKQMGALGMKSGGMKESKAMVGKEVAFMKKKGAPASMIKHEKAEMSAMKKGGMAKYARGGGIESKGKTKGTMIKMAAGGVVKFARGGGIESRGKTKGTMIKMNKGGYC